MSQEEPIIFKVYKELKQKELDEIEEYVVWNLSFGISVEDSLNYIHKSHLLEQFSHLLEEVKD